MKKAKEFFGMFPNWKTPTAKIKKEMKKGWEKPKSSPKQQSL